MMSLDNFLLNKAFLERVEAIIRECGQRILSRPGDALERIYKSDGSFATRADVESEKFLVKNLGMLMPKASFLGEEGGVKGDVHSEYQWVIDPIDGTTNFAQGIPYWAISVALTCNNEPVLGVVYNPPVDEIFTVLVKNGAFLNEKQIFVSQKSETSDSVIAIAVPCNKGDYEEFHQRTEGIEGAAYTVRRFGAAALDLAYVAAGRLDGALLKYVKWWDIAAGLLLVREAGGNVSEFGGGAMSAKFTTCLASNGLLHNNFKKMLL